MKHTKRNKRTGKFQAKRFGLKRIKRFLGSDNGKVFLIALIMILTTFAAELI
jgi:hypothetical protein